MEELGGWQLASESGLTKKHAEMKLEDLSPDFLIRLRERCRSYSGPGEAPALGDPFSEADRAAELLFDDGKYEDAAMLLWSAFNRSQELLGNDDPGCLHRMNSLGSVLFMLGRMDGARTKFLNALDGWKRTHGESSPMLIVPLNNLGCVTAASGDAGGAEEIFERVIRDAQVPGRLRGVHIAAAENLKKLTDSAAEPGHSSRASTVSGTDASPGVPEREPGETLVYEFKPRKTVESLVEEGELKKALWQALSDVEDLEDFKGPGDRDTLMARHALSMALYPTGDYEGAAKQAEMSAEGLGKLCGAGSREHVSSELALGRALLALARPGEAEARLARAAEAAAARGDLTGDEDLSRAVAETLETARLRPNEPVVQRTAGPAGSIGVTVLEARRKLKDRDWAAAAKLCREAIRASKQAGVWQCPHVMDARHGLGLALRETGDFRRSHDEFLLEVSARQRNCGFDATETLQAAQDLGAALSFLEDHKGASRLLSRVLEAREEKLGCEHPDTLLTMISLGEALRNLHDLEEALTLHGKALGIAQRVLGPVHGVSLMAAFNLACDLHLSDQLEGARELFEQAISGVTRTGEPMSVSVASARGTLATLLLQVGEPREAVEQASLAHQVFEKAYGRGNPKTVKSAFVLNGARQAEAAYPADAASPPGSLTWNWKRSCWIEAKPGHDGSSMPDWERHAASTDPLLSVRAVLEHASALFCQRRYMESAGIYARALKAAEAACDDEAGPTGVLVAGALYGLGQALAAACDFKGSIPYRERLLGLFQRLHWPTDENVLTSMSDLCYSRLKTGDAGAATALFGDMLDILERSACTEFPMILSFKDLLDDREFKGADHERCAEILSRELAVRRRMQGPDNPKTRAVAHCLSVTLRAMGNVSEAKALLAEYPRNSRKAGLPEQSDPQSSSRGKPGGGPDGKGKGRGKGKGKGNGRGGGKRRR